MTTMRVLSFGGGVQSSTLLLMAVHGELALERAIFADTQLEPVGVYDWLAYIRPLAEQAGIPIDVVTKGNLGADTLTPGAFAKIPLFLRNPSGKLGMLRRQCTKEYKVRPVNRRLRELGATRKRPATVVIGISYDEAHRMRDSRVQYVQHEYPLVERRLTRQDCLAWLTAHGYPTPPKSACVVCPFTDDARWREMKAQRPADWAAAVAFDREVRHATRVQAEAFVHRKLIPLELVDFGTESAEGAEAITDGECGAFSCFGSADEP